MKVIKTISLDLETVIALKKKNINISGLVNTFLTNYAGIKETNKGKKLEALKAEILKDEANLINKKKLTKELEEFKIKNEGIPFKLPCQ